MPVIVLSGEEELLISERVEQLKEKLLDKSWASFNFTSYIRPGLKEIIDAAAAVPFGPGNKIILFDYCELFTKKRSGKGDEETSSKSKSKGDSKGEKILEDLEQALAKVAEQTYLILVCYANFDKSLKVSKIFEKHAEIEGFERIKFWAGSSNAEMLNWCRKRAHKFGAVIDDEASQYLAESYEGDLRQIAKEIEKASVYVLPEKHISLQVVSQLNPHFSSTFTLLDHWVNHEKHELLTGLQESLSKQPALMIFALLQSTLSKWLSIKLACEKVLAALPAGRGIQRRELPAAELSKRIQGELKINPWILKMEVERVSKLKLEYIVSKKDELTRLEAAVKSGLIADEHALSIFFAS